MVALAALTVTGAGATMASSAKTHRKAAATAGSRTAHRSSRRVSTRLSSRTAHSRIPTGNQTRTTQRQTPEEVGWRAGLAIRERELRRAKRGPARVRAVSYKVHRADRDGLPGEPMPAEGVTADFGDSPAVERAAPETAIAPMPGTDAAQAGAKAFGETTRTARAQAANGDYGSAPAQQMATTEDVRPSGQTGTATNATAPADDGTDEENQGPPPTEATSVQVESETASLYVPRSGRLSPLRGSIESLTRQNSRLDEEGLERIEDEKDLAARIANGLLVPVPVSTGLAVNGDLLENHRYCRPWTAQFLADLAKAHQAMFHKPLEVSSAVRTVEYQRRLMMRNGNAAPAEGDIVSPHLTGATVDIAKSGLNRREMAWMRQRLLALQTAGKIDVEEEFRQACFHITVYKDYVPEHAPRPKHHTAPPNDESGTTEGL